MAACIVVPTEEQWAVLKPILRALGEGGVIISPKIALTLESEGINIPCYDDNYDFGGDADIWLEVVEDMDHFYIDHLKDDPNDDDDENSSCCN
jgi:hypothetical protein